MLFVGIGIGIFATLVAEWLVFRWAEHEGFVRFWGP
jgi:hypothetical protein